MPNESLTILYYHQANKSDLGSHWRYLRKHYRVLPLDKALEELNTTQKPEKQDHRPLLALTFDDGYEDNYSYAFSLARELQMPITIFLIARYTDCGNAHWWATRWLRPAQAETITFDAQVYHLDNQEERKKCAQALDASFSQQASSNEQTKFLTALAELLKVPQAHIAREEPAPLMTWAQVSEMQKSGYVSFGAHTLHHPDLAVVSNDVQQCEIKECRGELEQGLGQNVNILAYPFGRPGQYGIQAAEQAGYSWAVGTRPGINTRQTCQDAPYLLHRRNMDGNKHWMVVAAETAGIWDFFSHLKRRIIPVSSGN